ncbi:MAG: hypothetical protein C0614_03245 [Desulfuromonas sp.]|nr:MAG: hypothetical protein C0614_03245 [Desulfuromonas sp.]
MNTLSSISVADDKSSRLLKALIEIGAELASTVDLDELLERILCIVREVFHFENAIIRLLDDQKNQLLTGAAYGYADQAMGPIAIGQGITGRVAALRQPILVEDVRQHPDYVPGIPGALSELAVPLISKERLVGVFNVESQRPGAFTETDIEPLMTLGRQAAIAIDNARLYQRLHSVSEQYRQVNQFNERLLKSVNLGIYTIDTRLRITSWNRAMAEMSGIAADKAIGSILPKLFPNLLKEGVVDRIRRVLDGGSVEKLRLAHRNNDGNIRFQKRRLAPLRDGDEVTGVVVIVEDVTEFRRLLDQSIQSEKLAELGRLTAGIAHEINNPLSMIAYANQLLSRDGTLSPFQDEMVEKIDLEVERLKTLTGGLLTFSSNRPSRSCLVDLNSVVEDVLKLVRYELQRKGIQLETDYTPVPLVQADQNKLKQVVINLVMNAAQAIGQGQITVSTKNCADSVVEMTVADDGPGIPAEMQEQIFEAFYTTKPEGEGTGLGLYICRNIIREYSGEILIDSSPGQGTVFRVRLPAC